MKLSEDQQQLVDACGGWQALLDDVNLTWAKWTRRDEETPHSSLPSSSTSSPAVTGKGS